MTASFVSAAGTAILRRISRWNIKEKPHLIDMQDISYDGHIEVDVCLVTNCASGGGNAVSTLSEFHTLTEAGLRVAIIHSTINKSRWKRYWVDAKYHPVRGRIINAFDVERVRCKIAIIRSPKVVGSDSFARLAPRLSAEHAIFVVNNSAFNEAGRPGFDWVVLRDRVFSLDWPSVELCPIGPKIRKEARETLSKTGRDTGLSPRDWPPVFDQDKIAFDIQPTLNWPITIGRHARDHPSKWPESCEKILTIYPEHDPRIRVEILGGANSVRELCGAVPQGWIVHPFGSLNAETYLKKLDIFVFFPTASRREAFGRTIIEAVFAGRPAILPPAFRETFGDLALYCEPDQVTTLAERLVRDDAFRVKHVSSSRKTAVALYGRPALLKRLSASESPSGPVEIVGFLP